MQRVRSNQPKNKDTNNKNTKDPFDSGGRVQAPGKAPVVRIVAQDRGPLRQPGWIRMVRWRGGGCEGICDHQDKGSGWLEWGTATSGNANTAAERALESTRQPVVQWLQGSSSAGGRFRRKAAALTCTSYPLNLAAVGSSQKRGGPPSPYTLMRRASRTNAFPSIILDTTSLPGGTRNRAVSLSLNQSINQTEPSIMEP